MYLFAAVAQLVSSTRLSRGRLRVRVPSAAQSKNPGKPGVFILFYFLKQFPNHPPDRNHRKDAIKHKGAEEKDVADNPRP